MFDVLKSGVNQKPLRPLNLNESRDKHKEEFSCHLWHFAAGQPDDANCPLWNSSTTLDTLTWTTVPAELKKVSSLPYVLRTLRIFLSFLQRSINCSMLLVCPSTKFSELFSAVRHSLSTSHHLPLTFQHPIDCGYPFATMVSYPLTSHRSTIGLCAIT
jgi:hypothetical protein